MRLFCPSYQIPGSWAENAEAIASDPRLTAIDGIELLLFRYNDEDRELFCRDIPRLRRLAGRFDYTIHLPDPLTAEHRRLFRDAAELRAVNSGPTGAVMHLPPASQPGRRAGALELRDRFIDEFGIEICMENTQVSPCGSLPDEGALCLDTGHALLGGEEPAELLARFGERVEALHLHAVADGRDHAALDADQGWLMELMRGLKGFRGRLVLELFDLEKLVISLGVLDEVLENHETAGRKV